MTAAADSAVATNGKAADRPKLSKPIARLGYGIVYHVFAHILSFVTLLLLIFAYASSATSAPITPGGLLSNKPWLVHINQTSTSTIALPGDAASFTLRKWGLGTFGWCEWNFNPVDMQQPGKCTKKIGWQLPGSAEPGDDILKIEMPAALGKVLPIVSHFLILAILCIFAYFILLAFAYKYCPETDEKHGDGAHALPWARNAETRRLYDIIRSYKGGRSMLLLSEGITGVIVIVMAIGVAQLPKAQKLEASFGSGGYMVLASAVMISTIDLLAFFGGLKVKVPKKRHGR